MTHEIEPHVTDIAFPKSQRELELLLEALHALDHALDEYIETETAAVPAGD
jgi:hypothetical protein